MKHKIVTIITLLITMVFLSGCGEEYLNKTGEVFAKEHNEEQKTEIITSNYKQYERVYEEEYIIYVKYQEEFNKDYYQTYAFYVSKDIYESIEIGDSYLYNKDKDSLNPRVKTETLIEEDK